MREVVNYIPVRIAADKSVFLQIRTDDAPTRPGLLGLFGGGIKIGENVMQAFYREIPAELSYSPAEEDLNYFGVHYDEIPSKKHIYFEKVDQAFEKRIEVKEGKGGIFLTEKEIHSNPDIDRLEKEMLLKLLNSL